MPRELAMKSILLTGATGFVGSAVRPRLAASGWHVRCLTRDVARARAAAPGLDWVQGDVSDEAACAEALRGCQAALYLVHGIGTDKNSWTPTGSIFPDGRMYYLRYGFRSVVHGHLGRP